MKKIILAAMLSLSFSVQAAPLYTATGIQNDVSVSTVVNGGWTVLYRGDYSAEFALTPLLNSIAAGTNVMLAGIRDGATVFDVLGYAKKEEVFQLTGANQTHVANGAAWYFNTSSMGFAGVGDVINQKSADTNGKSERDRLSWHTLGTAANLAVSAGWRSGSNTGLNNASNWDRVILVQDAAVVPEPASLALLGLGLLGFAAARRRQA